MNATRAVRRSEGGALKTSLVANKPGRPPMKFVIAPPHMIEVKAVTQPWELGVTGRDQTRVIKRVEALGYDMVAAPEHFLIPHDHLELSGAHYLHAASAMAYMAGATETIGITSCVALLPLQNPIVQAKAYSTIDWMSGGRLTVTFGVGWLKEEFDLLGVPFNERGRIADEYLEAMIELWTKDKPVYEGRYVSFKDALFEPKPVQKPHMPIWMGGDADAVLKRTARFATGWWPFLTKPEQIPAKLDVIRSQPTFRGGPFEVVYPMSTSRIGEGHEVLDDPLGRPGMPAQEIIDSLGRLHDLGVTMSGVPTPPLNDVDAYLDHAQWVIEEIKPKVP
jgi:probable F420-dependent oxidoreductase